MADKVTGNNGRNMCVGVAWILGVWSKVTLAHLSVGLNLHLMN